MQVVNISQSYDGNMDRYEKISNSVQEILEKLGLTKNESKVYTYLNKNGSTKAKIIAQNQNIPRTQTYHLLNELQNKGIVTMISGTPTKFKGIEFEKALDVLINNEIKRIEELQLMRNELSELWKAKF
ncbi:MAG: helix-turn-helix domain-containing protein [Nitrosopumilus sp.]|nr:Rrf2 family transcriptional regulator [Nitrososphaerota archaeon]MCH9041531.1 Rrf2 family transcriptional regulator [Nitrososphaerota archaeon]